MIAFKTALQMGKDDSGIPSAWPSFVVNILDEDAALYLDEGFEVMTSIQFKEYKESLQSDFDSWANAVDGNTHSEELRVIGLVDDKFKNLPHEKIDFRMHLKPEIYLQKNVIMLPNGRPQKSVYTLNGELIAEIEFVFEVDQFNFMQRRKELLSYYKKSGQKSKQWVIADDMYDPSNMYHLREMMKERSGARASIIEEIKAFLNGVLAQVYVPQGSSYDDILNMVGDFWGKYSTPIDSWVNVGAPKFKEMLILDTEFEFLDIELISGQSVRDYILNKTSY